MSAGPLRVLYLEPYDGGSHAAFTRTLTSGIDVAWTVLTLPGRHWKWRMRGSAAWFARRHAAELGRGHDVVLAGSFLPLAELVGLVPALSDTPRLLYFHENQLGYPTRGDAPRDHHFGFTQLVSCLAADRVAFNSGYNRSSFLRLGRELLARMPDAVAPGWIDAIEARSTVIPVPVPFPSLANADLGDGDDDRRAGPILLWNHRWEHDKDPDAFFAAVDGLAERGVAFRLVVCGESFRRAPPVFAAARERHAERIVHWGHAPTRGAYVELLRRAHVAVSTSRQEYFGVALLEAAWCGAYPLAPNRLAYPEVVPAEHLYPDAPRGDPTHLVERLERLCRGFVAGAIALRADRRNPLRRFHADAVLPLLEAEVRALAARR